MQVHSPILWDFPAGVQMTLNCRKFRALPEELLSFSAKQRKRFLIPAELFGVRISSTYSVLRPTHFTST